VDLQEKREVAGPGFEPGLTDLELVEFAC
jgi:hypothetical protein